MFILLSTSAATLLTVLQLWTRKLYLNRNQVDEYYKLGQDEQDAWLNIGKININLSKYNMESWHKTFLNCKQRKYIDSGIGLDKQSKCQ